MGHYFINDNKLKSDINKITVLIKEKKYVFETDNGVFSKKGLDFGTRTLLETLDLSKIKGEVLDFGCGYGPIGIYIKDNTNANVDMVDVNKRSASLASKNALLNKVNVNVIVSDAYEKIDKKYDFIISNPPIRVGKEKLYEMLFSAKDFLKPNGEMWLVVNKQQGAKSLVKDLAEKYTVIVVDKNKGFYVIKAINNWQVAFNLLKL